jgi:hypothetical protein
VVFFVRYHARILPANPLLLAFSGGDPNTKEHIEKGAEKKLYRIP